MIVIDKKETGWEWTRVDENSESKTVGSFATKAECIADIKKHGWDEELSVALGQGEDISE